MPRSRNLKYDFFVNEYLGTCDPLEALFFEGLWTLADRYGRLENRPLRMKAQVFPYRDLSAQVITGYVRNLSDHDFLTLYTVNGQEYIEIKNFAKHQNPHKNEKGGEIPPPPQPVENNVIPKDSSNYSTPPVMQHSAPEGLCIRNDESCSDVSSNKGSASEDASPANPEKLSGVREFPVKNDKTYLLDEDFVNELRATYPRLDVEYQLQKARLWLIANPARQKTGRGMTRFLNNWLSNQKPTAEIHPIQSRHTGFADRDYSQGLIEGVSDDAANF